MSAEEVPVLEALEGAPLERTESALAENIREKGSNAYYYAHGMREGAEHVDWDGKEEPRLLRVEQKSAEAADQRPRRAIEGYGWYDDGAKVKVFVDRPGVGALGQEAVRLESGARSVTLIIEEGNVEHVLMLSPLKGVVSRATHRVKPDKVWVTLRKEVDSHWSALLDKDN